MENKGSGEWNVRTLVGTVVWKRKVGRCPNGCGIGQTAPLDAELGLSPNGRVRADAKRMGCLPGVFVPCGMAPALPALMAKLTVSPATIWNWVQEAGARSLESLEAELEALRRGEAVGAEDVGEILARMPPIVGDDGVRVPLLPNGASPEWKTEWKEVKVGISARLKWHVNRKGRSVARLLGRRLVAVFGDIDEFIPRMDLEARKQGVPNARHSHFKDDLGLPIGGGMVESACKRLIQQRFKCVGMRWSRKGLNHLLQLRIAWVNGRFDELFGVG